MENKAASSSNCSSRTERKIIERNRRNQMKFLYSTLHSLLPNHNSSKESVSLPDQLDDAVNYIKKLQIKLERMKERKESLLRSSDQDQDHHHSRQNMTMMRGGLRSPVIDVHETGSALQVVLITGLDSQMLFNEAVRVLHDEGADIVNASFSLLNHTIYHSIHSMVGDSAPGYAAATISERLNKFVQDSNAF